MLLLYFVFLWWFVLWTWLSLLFLLLIIVRCIDSEWVWLFIWKLWNSVFPFIQFFIRRINSWFFFMQRVPWRWIMMVNECWCFFLLIMRINSPMLHFLIIFCCHMFVIMILFIKCLIRVKFLTNMLLWTHYL